ncbi:MAG: Flp pilus assembly protein CpaB [Methylophilaceae bacterium 17-44-8]|nr:MAG: Flp pilus assembly protein CpaB [Methylophilaceae bacterium 17-44-8]
MNLRAVMLLFFALIAAIGAVVLASKWLQARSMQTTKIVVAQQEISMGQKLNLDMLKLIDWPKNSVPTGTFSDLSKLEGRVVKSTAQPGELILENKLAPEGTKGGLSAVISEGKRAITVKVNEVVGVAGFALPGNYVDIIVNTNQNDGSQDEQNISKIVLKHILVLAVGNEISSDENKPKVVNAVTLEVTPQQAEMIDLSRSVGNLSLVLRNQTESQDTETSGITKESLLALKPMLPTSTPAVVNKVYVKKVSKRQPNVNCTKVITGISETVECF